MAPASASCFFFFFFLPLSFLSHHVAPASPPLSFSFDFSNTSKYSLQDLRFEGDAALNRDLVDLTCNPSQNYCSGRMSYSHPVPLYDNNTGEVASFVTTFTFAIKLQPNTTNKGDGMTFFLSSYPSRLPPESSSNLLGLTNSSETMASGTARFLAVEFDTYANPWDPTGATDHMGINLNSITSVSTARLPSYSLNGTMTARIAFDNATRTLEATLNFDANNSLPDAEVKTQLPDDLASLLPPVVAVGFSAATGAYSELHQLHSWSFSSTMVAGETPTRPKSVHPEQGHAISKKGRHGQALIIGGAVILALALLLAVWCILSWYRWKHTRQSFGTRTRLKRYDYHDLWVATNRFTQEIGRGGFGVVYRGRLKDKDVAVKRILNDSRGDFKDFFAELDAISRTAHGNVVKLDGWSCNISNFKFWCSHRPDDVDLFLVYELVDNGNLHHHLYEKPDVVLPWDSRYKIVKDLCCALHYLHRGCKPYILHRDIKPSNILLDKDFNAKLGDFGLSRVAKDSLETSLRTTRAVGTALYMDPLCMKDGHVNFGRSSDVYSFGIVLLEIAHGKYDPDGVRRMHTDSPRTFLDDVADKKLCGNFVADEMERVILLGLLCSEPDDESKRPSLDVAILHFLEHGGKLPLATTHEDI